MKCLKFHLGFNRKVNMSDRYVKVICICDMVAETRQSGYNFAGLPTGRA